MLKSIPRLRNTQNNLWGKNAKYSTIPVNTISNLAGLCLEILANKENTNPIKLWIFHINNEPEPGTIREDDVYGKIYYLNMSIIIQSNNK
jgi:hypothetical protein